MFIQIQFFQVFPQALISFIGNILIFFAVNVLVFAGKKNNASKSVCGYVQKKLHNAGIGTGAVVTQKQGTVAGRDLG